MTTTSNVLGAALAAALVVACGSKATQFRPNTAQDRLPNDRARGVTEAQGGADQRTVDLIADARCDRAEECDEIGAGRRYSTRASCDMQNETRASRELDTASCARGADRGAVSRCVAAINRQECSTFMQTLSRIPDCRTELLCTR